MAYTVEIYRFAAQLPDAERYNLAAQLRRAATSVCLNIAEGSGCSTNQEFARFLGYAYRSLKETTTCLELCQRLYPELPTPSIDDLLEESGQISRMTHTLIRRLNPRARSSSENSRLRTQD